MVPVKHTGMKDKIERIETNLKYLIDLDLSEGEEVKDPLAFALYYHYSKKNQLQNINTTRLVLWARAYCHEKLGLSKYSKKKDTEQTAAMLAYSTLKQDEGFPEEKKIKIEENINNILSHEKDANGMYYGRPNFTAIILYAAQATGLLEEQDSSTQIISLVKTYKKSESKNNLLGLPFLSSLLNVTGQIKLLEELAPVLKKELENHLHEYDDKLYMVHSLWTYHRSNETLDQIQDLAEATISESPITISDIINKGDISDITVREDNRKISRLYKALLIDLITDYQRHLEALTSQRLDQRYSRETSLKWASFTAFTVLSSLPAITFIFFAEQKIKKAIGFWIFQQTNTDSLSLLTNTTALLIAAYLVLFATVGVYSLFGSIIKKQIVKDLLIFERYKAAQKKAAKWYGISIILALIFSIITRLAGNAFQSFIINKS